MNATIWIKDPYPFRFDEYDMLQEALRKTHGSSLVYMRDWPVDHVSIDGTTIATCKMIAATLKTVHLQYALLDRKYRGRLSTYCTQLEVVIQKPEDNKPDWAQPQKDSEYE